MDNIKNQKILDECIDDIFTLLKTDDEAQFITAIPSIENLLSTEHEVILKEIHNNKKTKLFASLSGNYLTKKLLTTDFKLLKAELNTLNFLIAKTYYLYNFNEKELLYSYFAILKNLLAADFVRYEWLSQNSNEGRTILSNYKLIEIQAYFDQIYIELEKIANLENTENTVKGLKLNEN